MAKIKANGFNVDVLDFQGNSYALVPFPGTISWEAARNHAQTLKFEEVDGHLATVTSKEENSFISGKILPLSKKYSIASGAWLGGTDEKLEGTWKWVTGEKWQYTNWDTNDSNSSSSDYLATYNGAWFSDGYSPRTHVAYVVEFEGTGTPDDNLVGTDKNDNIDGKDGDDHIIGRKGNDNLIGGPGEDILIGGAGKDKLDGGKDDDILIGGRGNDTYTVDSLQDIIIERPKQGKDLVKSSVNYNLSNNLENLTLIGKDDVEGIGNNRKNTIRGNRGNNKLEGKGGNDRLIGSSGNDILVGGKGKDILTGGSGVDRFFFESPKDGIDKITDFNALNETIVINSRTFDSLNPGKLLSNQFSIGSRDAKATTSDQRFIYTTDGSLFFDPDGKGGIEQTKITVFANLPFLSSDNFEIV